MGDRYELRLRCAYCDKEQDVYYAESSGFTTFICKECNKLNGLAMQIIAQKLT